MTRKSRDFPEIKDVAPTRLYVFCVCGHTYEVHCNHKTGALIAGCWWDCWNRQSGNYDNCFCSGFVYLFHEMR